MTPMPNDKAREKRLREGYNLSPKQADQISAYQGNVCYFCLKPQKSGKRLAIDHRHSDGLIRGSLCSQCNRLLGRIEAFFKNEAPSILGRIQRYLALENDLPAVKALGQKIYGYPGRVGTKKFRKYIKRQQKLMKDKECQKLIALHQQAVQAQRL